MRGEKKSPRQRVAKFKALMQNFGRFPFLKNRDPTGRTNFLIGKPPLAVRGSQRANQDLRWGGYVLSFAIPRYGIEGGSGAYRFSWTPGDQKFVS